LTGLSDAKGTDEEQEISPEEATHRRAIEQEKSVYRESFDKLRVLKPEIEHIRKLLEKSRGTLQTQFDQWYANLHARDGQLSHQSRSTYHSQQQQPSQQQLSHSSSSGDSKRYDDREEQYEAAKKSPRGVYSADAKPGAVGRSDNSGRSARGSEGYSPRSEERQKRASVATRQQSVVDDSDDDEDVNEDIEAFYKAKEELLKRRSNNNT